jgi:hypothetical protein
VRRTRPVIVCTAKEVTIGTASKTNGMKKTLPAGVSGEKSPNPKISHLWSPWEGHTDSDGSDYTCVYCVPIHKLGNNERQVDLPI